MRSCRNDGEERRFGDEWNDRKVQVGGSLSARAHLTVRGSLFVVVGSDNTKRVVT